MHEAFEAKAQGAGTPELKAECKNQVMANPMEQIGETELVSKGQAFLAEAQLEKFAVARACAT